MGSEMVGHILLRKEKPFSEADTNITTGLVVQGGGMRGIYSMAALSALEELGLATAFDHVLGSSAGAINGAFFLAGQSKRAVIIYLDELSNKQFINFMRLKKIVDIDYLIDSVLDKQRSLDVDKVINSSSTLHIIVTDFETGEPTVFTNRESHTDFMTLMRATASMPILYNRVTCVNGRGCVDGALSDAIPLKRAIALGCADILVILTRPLTFRRKGPGTLLRLVEGPFLRHYPESLKKRLLSEDRQFNRTMEYLENLDDLEEETRVMVVYPSNMENMVTSTTSSRSALLRCALMGRNDMRNALMFDSLDDNPFA
jgi:predicted patatin/cPLA2 family phospholipase